MEKLAIQNSRHLMYSHHLLYYHFINNNTIIIIYWSGDRVKLQDFIIGK